ncbi:MAG TPA: DOMON domain-containing protein [Saprospiraceae bacterium]|nr:DOMON domain-containing protein [Saprospiraceae bacterium]HMP25113.1 DOMON domain-containing protein [Saprospiraceae bacterium]
MKTIILGALLLATLPAQAQSMKTITKNGMTVQWKILGDSLQMSLHAPTPGWVAVGFNTSDQLQGTHLIMGHVVGKQVHIEDRYIRRPGDHALITSLGGSDALYDKHGTETDVGTTLHFKLPLRTCDDYHIDLQPSKSYYLLMAYSREDDFEHHSMMRTSIKIIL